MEPVEFFKPWLISLRLQITNKSSENIHHDKNIIEDNKSDKDSLLISQQLQKSKNQVSDRNEREKNNQQNKDKEKEKHSQRSLSQPQSEILKQIDQPKPKKKGQAAKSLIDPKTLF